MMNKQNKFENFMNAQIEKQRKVWFNCLPNMMKEMTRAINLTKENLFKAGGMEKMVNFESKTLVKLRPMYAEIEKIMTFSLFDYDAELRSRELMNQMITQLNGWKGSSKIEVGINTIMDTKYSGKANIAKKYELVISFLE